MNSLKIKMPNMISLCAITLGVAGILLSNDKQILSFILILGAMMLDFLDGYIARKFQAESMIGQRLDGFADMIVYLIYPIQIIFRNIAPNPVLIISLIALLFSGVWRLARQESINQSNKIYNYYTGIPVCFNLILVAVLIFQPRSQHVAPVFWPLALLLLSYLMISQIHFPKPKQIWPWLIIFATLVILLIEKI